MRHRLLSIVFALQSNSWLLGRSGL